jgi:hypothetical protein
MESRAPLQAGAAGVHEVSMQVHEQITKLMVIVNDTREPWHDVPTLQAGTLSQHMVEVWDQRHASQVQAQQGHAGSLPG